MRPSAANALRRAVGRSMTSKTAKILHKKLGVGRELFEKYYRAQRVCGDADDDENEDGSSDFDEFMRALDAPLPVTFRVHRAHALSKDVSEALRAGGCVDARGVRGAFRAPSDGTLKRGRPRVPRDVLDVFEFATANGCGARQEIVSMLPVVALFGDDEAPTTSNSRASPARVLDVCAAPGQKTMQLLEHVACRHDGVVHANDAHPGRVKTLMDAIDRHRRRAQETSRLLVTRAFGQDLHMPLFAGADLKRVRREIAQLETEALKTSALVAIGGYSHILADVPCSGDGTIRKDAECLARWSPGIGNALHATQLAVARKCAQLLKPGGTMVYSTCTFNPIEDEAVVAALLSDESLALVIEDVFARDDTNGNDIVSRSGLHTWRVGDHVEVSGLLGSRGRTAGDDDDDDDVTLKWFASFADAVAHEGVRTCNYATTMWPPPLSKAAELQLDKCCRFLPHDMDTGGFFICKLRKRDDDATRRAFAKRVEHELTARVGGDERQKNDAKKKSKMVLSADDARDEALDRLVPVHRVSKDLARELCARFGQNVHYAVDIARRRVYAGASTPVSAVLDYECGNRVRLSRAGCLLLHPTRRATTTKQSSVDPSNENLWDVRTIDETMCLHVAGVRALMESFAVTLLASEVRQKQLPCGFLAMLPTELDAVLEMGGEFIAMGDFSEPTQKNAKKTFAMHLSGPVVLCLRKRSGEIVFAAPGAFDTTRGVALAPDVSDEDGARLSRELRQAAAKKKTKAHHV